MKQTRTAVWLVLMMLLTSWGMAQRKVEIISYCPNWYRWGNRLTGEVVDNIPYNKITIINYAFIKTNPNGSLSLFDKDADPHILLGPMDWSINKRNIKRSLPYMAHQNNVKVLCSIGGWTLSNEFSQVAADPAKRKTFANSCVEFIKTYKFDGVDIDWEYPGVNDPGRTPNPTPGDPQNDPGNFVKLLREVRTALDQHGSTTGQRYLLTAALAADRQNKGKFILDEVLQILDYVNLMTYDFFGPWDSMSNHNAPLFAPAQGAAHFNVSAAVDYYSKRLAGNKHKIIVGVPFYGRSFAGCDRLFGKHSGADKTTWPLSEGMPDYYKIVEKLGSFDRLWDAQAKVPYRVRKSAPKSLLSYDDAESIQLKAQFINQQGLGGAMVWHVFGDRVNGTNPLLDALRQGLSGGGAINFPPAIRITAPADKQKIKEGGTINVTANASDSDGRVTKVEFFFNNTSVTDTQTPYSAAWSNVMPRGIHAIKAIATDDKGATASSAVTIEIVDRKSCLDPPWDRAKKYFKDDLVSHKNRKWKAKWEHGGQEPGADKWGPWEDLGPCNSLSGVGTSPGKLADQFELKGNYPNPFNPATVIEYQLPRSAFVTLQVYDLLGREVQTLVREIQAAGSYKVRFDGAKLNSGVYIYRIKAGDDTAIRKMLLIK